MMYVYILLTTRQSWLTSLQPYPWLAGLGHSPPLPPGGSPEPSGSPRLLAPLLTSLGKATCLYPHPLGPSFAQLCPVNSQPRSVRGDHSCPWGLAQWALCSQ